MVFGQIIEGRPKEIGDKLRLLVGDRKVSVVLMEAPDRELTPASHPSPEEIEKVLADIAADAARVGHVDDSREAIYTRMEGE
jgi:hypothetical protein